MSDDNIDAQFTAWLAGQQRNRVTGWEAWQAALVHAGRPPDGAAASRDAFDYWLANTLMQEVLAGRHWDLQDAWRAAKHWYLDKHP